MRREVALHPGPEDISTPGSACFSLWYESKPSLPVDSHPFRGLTVSSGRTGTRSPTEVEKESFAIDGTERRCQRPSDQEEQKQFYSGKKKTHTVKSNVIVTLGKRRVEYLSGTCEGRKHDKKVMSFQKEAYSTKIQVSRDMNQREFIPVNPRRSQEVESWLWRRKNRIP
jgi:hypothetical protein